MGGAQVPEAAVGLLGRLRVARVQHAQQVHVHPVPAQQVEGRHRSGLGGVAVPGGAEAVVGPGRAVQAQAHGEALGGQEPGPVGVQQGAVGLQPVAHGAPGRAVGLLQLDDAPEVVQAQQGGFAPVPFEVGRRAGEASRRWRM